MTRLRGCAKIAAMAYEGDDPGVRPASLRGVSSSSGQALGDLTIAFQSPRAIELLSAAEGMADERPENAVITAQIAVEVCVQRCFELLLRLEVDRDEAWMALVACVPDASLMDKRTRRLWQALTGDQISSASIWKPYQQHVERRNTAVHVGETVPRAEVDASIRVSRAMIEHMQDTVARILGLLSRDR
jgi:hypothetical protein